MAGPGQTAVTLYQIQNYNFGVKDPKPQKEPSLERLQQKYQREGLRRSVEAALLVHEHSHPHVLLLQPAEAQLQFRLPGGRLRPGEGEVAGLKRKLASTLSPTSRSLAMDWEVVECIGTYWRPGFDSPLYPYVPAHITRPKEARKLYLVALPERCYFAVPKNLKLIAVPLFELYGNTERYGTVIAALPQLISRCKLNLAGGRVPASLQQQPVRTGEVAVR